MATECASDIFKSFACIVFNFQTLVAGAIAIIAAGIGAWAVMRQTSLQINDAALMRRRATVSALIMTHSEISGMIEKLEARKVSFEAVARGRTAALAAGQEIIESGVPDFKIGSPVIYAAVASALGSAPYGVVDRISKFYNGLSQWEGLASDVHTFASAINTLLPLIPRVLVYAHLAQAYIAKTLTADFDIVLDNKFPLGTEAFMDAAIKAGYDLEKIAAERGDKLPPEILQAYRAKKGAGLQKG